MRREQNDQCVSGLPFDVGRAVSAMRCQKCERVLSDDEPIYRVGVGYDGALYFKLRFRSVGHVCENCRSHPYEPSRDSKSKPCGSCGRPVIDVGRRNPRKHVSCGPECKYKLYLALAKAKRRRPTKVCAICNMEFQPRRAASKYCSAAHRHKSYRQTASTPF